MYSRNEKSDVSGNPVVESMVVVAKVSVEDKEMTMAVEN